MLIRPKAKRRIAFLGAVVFVLALAGGLLVYAANKHERARLDAERVAALADYRAGNFAAALPHLRHYLDKSKDGDEGDHDKYLDAMFAYGKCRMNVRQVRNAHLVEAKSILQNYLAQRPNDLDAQHTLLTIYPQIDYQQEQLTLARAVLDLHPDDEKALAAEVQALMNQTRPDLPGAKKACDRLNAKWPADLEGQLLGMEIRSRMLAPPIDLVARAQSLQHEHDGDPRFELLLGATYLGVSRLPVRPDTAGGAVPAAVPATGLPATGPAGPSESARASWRAQGLRWLVAAADRTPPDADFVIHFVRTADLNDLFPLSLDVLRKDAPLLHDRQLDAALAQRLWENYYDQELLERTAGLDPTNPSTDVASLAYRAFALYEVASASPGAAAAPTTAPAVVGTPAGASAGAVKPAPPASQASPAEASAEAAAIVRALSQRKDDPSAEAWALLLRAKYGAAGGSAGGRAVGARDVVKQCLAALAKDPDNAVAFLLCGEAYNALGEKETAAARWDEAAWHAPDWAVPHVLVARLRLAQGRNDEALARARAALVRSPQLQPVRAVHVLAWYAVLKDSPRDSGKAGAARAGGAGATAASGATNANDKSGNAAGTATGAPAAGVWDRLLAEVRSIQQQWPREPETLPLYVSLLAESGQRQAAADVLNAAATASPPPPTETLLALEEVSRSHDLKLSDALLNRARAADANSITLAVRRALDRLSANDPDAGLALLKEAQKAAKGENDPAWQVAVAAYLERANAPAAAKTWIELGDKYPSDLLVQSAVLRSAARFGDRAFWKRSIDRLKALTGDDGQLWRLERCRWILTGDGAAGEGAKDPKDTRAARDARDARANKDRSEAITTLTELTREFPNESEPHRLLAVAFERDNKPDRAAEEMGQAVSLQPADVEASLELARLLRLTGKGAEARAAVDRAARRPGLAPAARRLLASAYEQQGNPQKAIEVLTATVAADGSPAWPPPAGPDTRPSASPGGAPGDAAEAAARDGMLARLYARVGRLDRAEALYNQLLDNPAAPAQDLADGAELFASQGRSDRSREFLTRLAGMNLPPGVLQVIMGRFDEQFDRAGDASQRFTEATRVAPKSAAAWRELAGFHIRHVRLEEAAAAADQGLKAVPGDPALSALSKDLALLKRCQRPALVASLGETLVADPADPAANDLLEALAESKDRNETPGQRVARLKEVAGRHPEFFPAQEQLILAYLEQRQFQSAADVATAAVQAAPNDVAPPRLATGVYLAAGQTARALDAALIWRQRSGSNPLPADLAIAEALVNLNRPREAVDRLAPYLSKPAPPIAPGATTQATQTTPVASAPTPNWLLYRMYGRALIAAGRGRDAAALLTPLLGEAGTAAEGTAAETAAAARMVWLSLAPAHKSADAASAWLEQIAPRLSDGSSDERLALAETWREIGSQFASVPALQKARDLVSPLIHRPDADVSAWAVAAQVAQELGDYDIAEQGWRRILQDAAVKRQTVTPEVRNNLAYVLMIRGDKSTLPEARQLAEQAVAAAPDSSNFYDTLARIESRLGNREQAIKTFRTALSKDAGNVEAMIGLADELSQGGTREDVAAARALLPKISRAMEKGPSLSGPLQEQLKNLRSRASLDVGDGR